MYNSCSDPAKTSKTYATSTILDYIDTSCTIVIKQKTSKTQTPTAYATILDYINTLCTIAAVIKQKPQKPKHLCHYT